MRFLKNHWKALLVLVIAIILIVAVIIIGTKIFSDKATTQIVGIPGIVTLDGQSVGVFETQEEAEEHKVPADAGVRKLSISGSGNISVRTKISSNFANILTNTKGHDYDLDLTDIGNNSTVILQISVGGDGSIIGERLSGDVDKYYLAISVNNPNPGADTAKTLGVPYGKIYFGDSSYQTYGSESEAQQAVQNMPFVLPTYMVKNGIQLRAEPDEGTARIWVKPCLCDDDVISHGGPCLYVDNGWSDVLDVSEFAGHQVTLMIHAENAMGLSNGYTYVSFFVPQLESEANVASE